MSLFDSVIFNTQRKKDKINHKLENLDELSAKEKFELISIIFYQEMLLDNKDFSNIYKVLDSFPSDTRIEMLEMLKQFCIKYKMIPLYSWLDARFGSLQEVSHLLHFEILTELKDVALERVIEIASDQDVEDFITSKVGQYYNDFQKIMSIISARNIDISAISEELLKMSFNVEEFIEIIDLERDSLKKKKMLVKVIRNNPCLSKEQIKDIAQKEKFDDIDIIALDPEKYAKDGLPADLLIKYCFRYCDIVDKLSLDDMFYHSFTDLPSLKKYIADLIHMIDSLTDDEKESDGIQMVMKIISYYQKNLEENKLHSKIMQFGKDKDKQLELVSTIKEPELVAYWYYCVSDEVLNALSSDELINILRRNSYISGLELSARFKKYQFEIYEAIKKGDIKLNDLELIKYIKNTKQYDLFNLISLNDKTVVKDILQEIRYFRDPKMILPMVELLTKSGNADELVIILEDIDAIKDLYKHNPDILNFLNYQGFSMESFMKLIDIAGSNSIFLSEAGRVGVFYNYCRDEKGDVDNSKVNELFGLLKVPLEIQELFDSINIKTAKEVMKNIDGMSSKITNYYIQTIKSAFLNNISSIVENKETILELAKTNPNLLYTMNFKLLNVFDGRLLSFFARYPELKGIYGIKFNGKEEMIKKIVTYLEQNLTYPEEMIYDCIHELTYSFSYGTIDSLKRSKN